ncbi:MAG: ABC transporter substrate-binding protein [Rhodocyclaceae bacterium]
MQRRQFLKSSLAVSSSLILPAGNAWAARGEWVVGQSVDLSGDNQNMGRDYFTGAKIAFDQSNLNGGVHGRLWRHVVLDDTGSADLAVSNTRRLLREANANFLFGYTNEPCVQAVLQSAELRNAGMVLFAPQCGVSFPGDEQRAIYLRATYGEEIVATLRQYAEGRITSFMIVHTNALASTAARDAALTVLRERELPTPALKLLSEDGSNMQAVAEAVLRAAPQVVVILAGTLQSALLTKQLRARNPGLFICVTSGVDATVFRQLAGPAMLTGVVFSRVVPNPVKGTEPIVREFGRTLTKLLDETPTTSSLEGYIAARALIQLVQRQGDAKRGERMPVLEAAREAGVLDCSGWRFDFRRGGRASRYADTSIISRDGGMLG